MTANQPALEQSLILCQGPGINISIQAFDLRHCSLDGPSDSPGGHQSPSASLGRGASHASDDTDSHSSTEQCSENESSENALVSPQTPLRQMIPTWISSLISVSPRLTIDGSPSRPSRSPRMSDPWDIYKSDTAVANYRAIGAQYQAWIADTATTPCPIRLSTLTMADIVENPHEEYRFEVCRNEFRSPPDEVGDLESVGLSMANTWRLLFLRRYGSWDDDSREGWTAYQHRTAHGAIFAENITRHFGPYWSQIALAQYAYDHHIDTLRHVYVVNIQNLYTWPYVESCLYPRHGLQWYDDDQYQCWEYGTREYQELLGTKLGRGVARLVLSAWPRGTHRIEAIITWTYVGTLQMRFDIERI